MLIPIDAQMVIPDLRWVLGGILACTFLLVGWIRALRRET